MPELRKRAGRWARESVRQDVRRLLVRQWRVYLKLALLFAAGAAVSLALMPPLLRAFFGGVWITAYVALVYYSFALHGLHYRMAGADAETWTSRCLRRLRRWWVIDRVEFEHFDVDHVAVGPTRVLAVETKWTAKPLTVTSAGVFGMGCDPVAQAKDRAEKLEKLLKSRGDTTPVVAVLVLWGPGVPQIDNGKTQVGDVRVLNGTQFDQLAQAVRGAPLAYTSHRGHPCAVGRLRSSR